MAISRQNLGLITVFVVVALVCATVFWNVTHAAAMDRFTRPLNSSRMLGRIAPNFHLMTDRGVLDLESTDRPVFLEIFATWCGHCKTEVATVNAVYKEFRDSVSFVAVTGSPYGIDGTSPESLADVRHFSGALHMAYPVAFDPTLSVSKSYLVGAYPTIIVIDRAKRVTFEAAGEIPRAILVESLNRLR